MPRSVPPDDAIWPMAMSLRLDVDFDQLRPALDELADAMFVWLDDPELTEITDRAVETLWTDQLAADIREILTELSTDSWCRRHAKVALRDFDALGRLSDFARAAVQVLAMELSHEDVPVLFCPCCVDEHIASTDDDARRAALAAQVAVVARRDVDIGEEELRTALRRGALRPGEVAASLATDDRRERLRQRIERIARLAAKRMPHLARELRRLLREDDGDLLWCALCEAALAEIGRPEWN